jgi:N-methylhydantoinase B/oxoprolinase/acetone carboxylase alpha subunit
MRTSVLVAAMAAALSMATAAQAQPPAASGDRTARRERMEQRREKLQNMTPEQREQAKAKAKEHRATRLESLSPEGRAWVQSRDAEARRVAQEVQSGALTREQAREQLRAWSTANPRPESLKPNG